MEKIIINNSFLEGYKRLSIHFENCDGYEIDVTDILDIRCEAVLVDKKGKEYLANDGFIKISVTAKDKKETSVLRQKHEGEEIDEKGDIRLKERLEMCGGCVDMCSFSLCGKKGESLSIGVPYAPLESVLHDKDITEIEYSNCPSLETDEHGNMIIAFGESSKQPKRTDNNFSELIEGWAQYFGEYAPKVLKIKLKNIKIEKYEKTNILLFFDICNKDFKKEFVGLYFMDCKNIGMSIYCPETGECELKMSRMADGRIYVGLSGFGLEFTCVQGLEYGACWEE